MTSTVHGETSFLEEGCPYVVTSRSMTWVCAIQGSIDDLADSRLFEVVPLGGAIVVDTFGLIEVVFNRS
jgi:hypothetical protein